MPHDLDPQTMQRLVLSRPWQAYLDWLLVQYDQVCQRLDQTTDDHRFVQGVKHGLTLALETPYRVGEMDSPLSRPSQRRPRRLKPESDRATAPDPVPAVRRRSYLA